MPQSLPYRLRRFCKSKLAAEAFIKALETSWDLDKSPAVLMIAQISFSLFDVLAKKRVLFRDRIKDFPGPYSFPHAFLHLDSIFANMSMTGIFAANEVEFNTWLRFHKCWVDLGPKGSQDPVEHGVRYLLSSIGAISR